MVGLTEVVIRAPDQRLRVFVSSTLGELAEERRAVSRAISALRLTPVMFELGARPHPPQDVYRAYLAQSDVFIGLYWQRYGWIGPGMEISGLEEEFELGSQRYSSRNSATRRHRNESSAPASSAPSRARVMGSYARRSPSTIPETLVHSFRPKERRPISDYAAFT
jgi:hypothetical protein